MLRTAFALALFVVAGSALAQEERTRPDYSRDSLLRLFVAAAEDYDQPIRYDRGAVEFRTLGTTWKFNYVPMMAFSGSVPTTYGRELPDPFALTGTQIATSPRAWRTTRQINSELRRIEMLERARVRVDVESR
jgi:hypothetical protein